MPIRSRQAQRINELVAERKRLAEALSQQPA
jgi:hypothetical protein